jgi:ketosteroid isomerase-like protein
MAAIDYREYLATFNSTDMSELISHYAPDVVIEGPRGVTPRDEFLEQLRDARDGVSVSASPITVLGDDEHLMAELDITYSAERDRPDHPVVPLRAGEAITMRFFVSYDVSDGVITRFSRSFWRLPEG